MLNLKAVFVATLLILPVQVQAQTACESYTVVKGDTLRLIAERVYGSRDDSPFIYDANRSVVGGNPNTIEIGMQLVIPCGAGDSVGISIVTGATPIVVESPSDSGIPAAPTAVVEAPVEQESPPVTVDTVDVVFPDQPAFISVGMYPPFSDGDGNGMMTSIVRAALGNSEYLSSISVNAVSLPFDPLMASADPDVVLSFPWINPGCDNSEFLSEKSRNLCDNYQFSHKAYEIVMTFFVADRGGLAQATDASQFFGKRICVPEQYPTNHLREAGFNEQSVTIVRGNSVAECMSKLLSGQVDVVNADYLSVEATYAAINRQSIIVENPSFTWIRSVHAIANVNPASLQTLSAFNDGLNNIKANGDWLTVIQPFLR